MVGVGMRAGVRSAVHDPQGCGEHQFASGTRLVRSAARGSRVCVTCLLHPFALSPVEAIRETGSAAYRSSQHSLLCAFVSFEAISFLIHS
jgi:hypothetical protein